MAKSHSQTLYAKTADQLKKDIWALLILYKGRYPDAEIERILIKILYEVAPQDGEPRRGSIVEAIKEVGSEAVLPTLEAIAHDLEPGVKVGQAFGDALGLLGSLSAKARYSFLQDVLVAIDEIKQRVKLVRSTGTQSPPLTKLTLVLIMQAMRPNLETMLKNSSDQRPD